MSQIKGYRAAASQLKNYDFGHFRLSQNIFFGVRMDFIKTMFFHIGIYELRPCKVSWRAFACESLGGQNPELNTENTINHLSNFF